LTAESRSVSHSVAARSTAQSTISLHIIITCAAESDVLTATIVALLEAIAHSEVVARSLMSEVATAIPRPVSIVVPAVSAAIDVHESRSAKVKVVAVRIASVYSEVPIARIPVQRTIEIVSCAVGTVLPIEQYVTQIQIASRPINAVQVVWCHYVHQIIQVYFVSSLVLCFVQIELIRHLVG